MNQDRVVKQEIVSAVVRVRELMGKLSQHQTMQSIGINGILLVTTKGVGFI
ncbi:hypothetical protein [Erwinia sp. S59]|uniref:hypothetical protein n=1 Tax=Erwinia sp. S59 TaxID=2769340 RepID=UPI00190D0758|nr:hypothetical protein [Erwinia sp. S59]MBK0090794.1 hypothetical protein [Erwinia sp. S59]